MAERTEIYNTWCKNGYTHGYIIGDYSYSIFRWVYTVHCDCGWSYSPPWGSVFTNFNDVVNLFRSHATPQR